MKSLHFVFIYIIHSVSTFLKLGLKFNSFVCVKTQCHITRSECVLILDTRGICSLYQSVLTNYARMTSSVYNDILFGVFPGNVVLFCLLHHYCPDVAILEIKMLLYFSFKSSEQNYSESRYHFLHSSDGEGCAHMLVEYSASRGFRSEVDMFVAQAVLQ